MGKLRSATMIDPRREKLNRIAQVHQAKGGEFIGDISG
jgi:hypothetical protein